MKVTTAASHTRGKPKPLSLTAEYFPTKLAQMPTFILKTPWHRNTTTKEGHRSAATVEFRNDAENFTLFLRLLPELRLTEQTLGYTPPRLTRASLSAPRSPLTPLASALAAAGVVTSSGGEAHPEIRAACYQ